jgi:hypothetical protein
MRICKLSMNLSGNTTRAAPFAVNLSAVGVAEIFLCTLRKAFSTLSVVSAQNCELQITSFCLTFVSKELSST